MHKLEVKLKQHTPLIHFQHEQYGATLRASEVKPRLDKYILTKFGGDGGYEEGIKKAKEKGLLIGKGDKPALDYKMRITEESKEEYLLATSVGATRQNELDSRNIKFIAPSSIFGDEKTGIVSKGLCITIHSSNLVLNNIVKAANLPLFFLLNNFGFRQSKGYGSYTVESINDEECNWNGRDELDILKETFSHIFYTSTLPSFKVAIEKLSADYQLFKSGKNFGGYQKSKLFEYFCYQEKKMRWEKRKIKQSIKAEYPKIWGDMKYDDKGGLKNRILDCENSCSSSEDFVFARAILGLAEHIEFTMKGDRGGI